MIVRGAAAYHAYRNGVHAYIEYLNENEQKMARDLDRIAQELSWTANTAKMRGFAVGGAIFGLSILVSLPDITWTSVIWGLTLGLTVGVLTGFANRQKFDLELKKSVNEFQDKMRLPEYERWVKVEMPKYDPVGFGIIKQFLN